MRKVETTHNPAPGRETRHSLIALLTGLCLLVVALPVSASPPVAKYIFPAGGQRGTTVQAKVGGCYFHGEAGFEMLGKGVEPSSRIREIDTLWFESPLIPQPASQQAEDYPRDHACSVKIATDADVGVHHWRAWTSQGATSAGRFIIGDLPEVVERETEGTAIPVQVNLPVTINGRIFPRENVDVWSFAATKGREVTCDVWAKRLGSPLDAELEVFDPTGRQVPVRITRVGGDQRLRFKPSSDGQYQLRIHDVGFGGLQNYVYRLTITADPYVDSVYPLGGRRGTNVKLELTGQAVGPEPVEVKLPPDAAESYAAQLGQDQNRTNPVLLDVDDLPEALESEPNDTQTKARTVAAPAVCNGRIDRPGDVDYWAVEMPKGQMLELEVRASRLGSPVDSVLTVFDANGKQVARNDDATAGQTDSRLTFKSPADGVYCIHVEDRFASRGGPTFAYRLRIASAAEPDFRLALSADAITAIREPATRPTTEPADKKRSAAALATVKVNAQRIGGFEGPITLEVEGLPQGVTISGPTVIAAKQPSIDIKLAADASAKIGVYHLRVRGTAQLGEKDVTRAATFQVGSAAPAAATGGPVMLPLPGEAAVEDLLLAVAMPTPFRLIGEFATVFAPLGSEYRRRYRIERNGFEGPLTVRLADRQVRHLQGVVGPTISVPAAADTFEYGVRLSTRMELGRTSRSTLMVSGVVKDPDGSEHVVSFSSGEQNDQFIAIATAGMLDVRPEAGSVAVRPNETSQVRVQLRRAPALRDRAVRVELVIPAEAQGVAAEPIIVPPGQDEATLVIKWGMHPKVGLATIRASTEESADKHVAEIPLELSTPARVPDAKQAGR